MKKIFLLFTVVFTSILAMSFAYMHSSDNRLSKTEKKEGWKLLFDGSTTDGWRYYKNQPSTSWEVSSGTLHSKGSAENYGSVNADLMTKDKYENFDLSIDWKISPKGNSGILYMVTEEYDKSYLSGPEYQIIDDVNFPEKLQDWQKTGANYAMDAAPTAAPKPAGEWNNTRIVVDKGHVQHWLNGKKLLDFQMWTDEWKRKKMKGKWKDAPGYGMTEKGYIALQDHGSEAWFKNIKIKEL